MKKLFFAAAAAMAIVSVSNIFASEHISSSLAGVSDTDTVASIAIADTTDTTAAPATAEPASFADTTDTETPAQQQSSLNDEPDTTAQATPDSVPAQH